MEVFCISSFMHVGFNRLRCATIAVLAIAIIQHADVARADAANQEELYTRTIEARAEKIVKSLGLTSAGKARRVRRIIVDQYRGLRDIHDSRDAKIERIETGEGDAQSASDFAIEQLRQRAENEQFKLHREFVAKLDAELTPEQLTGVKDGMTYGVVPRTYARYCQLFPNLSEEERNALKAFLFEAREYAMDGGSSEEKHSWFRKYKGKINNYLSSAGYNLKEAEKRVSQQ